MELKDHIADFHNNDNAEATCSECNFEAKTPGEQKHLKDSTEEQTIICEECNAIFEEKFHVEQHKDSYHESNFNISAATCSCGDCDPEEVFPCEQCNLIFNCHNEWRIHKRLQHTNACYDCYTRIWSEPKFNNHIAWKQKFQCNKCGVKFADSLGYHEEKYH